MDLLFNFDIVNLLLKTNGGRVRRPNFVILWLGVLGWWWCETLILDIKFSFTCGETDLC